MSAREARVVEPVFRESADFVVLDQHVGLPREIADDALSVGGGEVDGDGELAAIAAEVVRGFAGVVAVRRP